MHDSRFVRVVNIILHIKKKNNNKNYLSASLAAKRALRERTAAREQRETGTGTLALETPNDSLTRK